MEYYYNSLFKKEFCFGRRTITPKTENAKKLLKIEGYPSIDKIYFRNKKIMMQHRNKLYFAYLKYYVRSTLPNKYTGGII